MNKLFIITLTLILTACTSSKTHVVEYLNYTKPVEGITIKHVADAECLKPEIREHFLNTLTSKLYEENNYKYGNDITLSYSFECIQEGNRFMRYMIGPFSDTANGKLIVAVTYLDPFNKIVGKIESQAKISGGLWGGSFDNAIEKVAQEITEYTVTNFKRKT